MAENTTGHEGNFGNAETIPSDARYFANFNGDEINGRTYELGEEIDSSVDAGTLRYLVQNGRITEQSAGDSGSTSTGEAAGAMMPQGGNDAERSRLMAMTKADLLDLAKSEKVEASSDNNKDEIVSKILDARSS